MMNTLMNHKAFTLVELLAAIGFSVLLMSAVFGFYNASSQVYSSGIISQNLQDGAVLVLKKIMEGSQESGIVYRLATASSYYIPNGNFSQLYFCQDNSLLNPCGPADTTARWYTLDPTQTSLLYYHPTSNPLGYDVIYTAPPGSTLTLRFSPPPLPAPPEVGNQAVDVVIDVTLTQNVPEGTTNNAVAATGTASTYVLLRNHS